MLTINTAVSPWFFTHFQDNADFGGKNWVGPSDSVPLI